MATTPVPTFTLNNGQSIPGIGLGTWLSDKGNGREAVKVAIECGYRHIDTAWAYYNEAEIGEGIKEKIDDGTIKRDELFITTKLWNAKHRPDVVEGALLDSLQKLGVDCVDLYLMHWPFAFKGEDEGGQMDAGGKWQFSDVDYLDTWKAMELLVEKGLTRSIGVSNFNSKQLGRLLSQDGLKYRPVMNQIEVNPYLTNEKLISYCKEEKIAVTGYAPLGSTGRPTAKPDDPCVFDEPTLKEIGKKYGKSAAQVALRWGVQQDIIIIPKSATPSRIQENFQIEVNPYLTNEKLISYCKEEKIAVTGYAPLGSTGRPTAKPDHPCVFDEPTLKEIGKKYGKSAAQVALRWGVQQDIIIIPKSATPSRIQENFQIFDFELTKDEMNAVSALNRNFRACGFCPVAEHRYYPFNVEF